MWGRIVAVALAALGLAACSAAPAAPAPSGPPKAYFDAAANKDAWSGGSRMIAITTPKGRFNVWTKRVGNNPKLKVLLLHGGPAVPHQYLEAFDSYLPGAGIEYFYYDQLGAGNSDKPDDDSLWTIERYVDEVEQVRVALGLDAGNFCLYGQSWGGMLAIEYALKYQKNLKCLIISNMMASIPAYNDYARKVLMPAMDQAKLADILKLEKEGKTADPRYMALLIPAFYEQHILRRPASEWPDNVNRAFAAANNHIYTLMQGPSEMGASGRLANWDRFDALRAITVPTLVMAGKYDTMDPAYLERMSKQLPKGQYALMPEGSHLSMYDDQVRYFAALTAFLKKQE